MSGVTQDHVFFAPLFLFVWAIGGKLQKLQMRSAGSNLQPAHEMAIQGTWELYLSDLQPVDEVNSTDSTGTGCLYRVNKSLNFNFKEGLRYAFALSVNGVEGTGESFTVTLAPKDPVDLFINWFLSAMAAIVAVILLISNVTQHHWGWFILSLLCTLGLSLALPLMSLHKVKGWRKKVWQIWQIWKQTWKKLSESISNGRNMETNPIPSHPIRHESFIHPAIMII